MCHVSHVTCHVSHVICHMSHVTCYMPFFLHLRRKRRRKKLEKNGQSGGASLWRVCYKQGLPRLVYRKITGYFQNFDILTLVTYHTLLVKHGLLKEKHLWETLNLLISADSNLNNTILFFFVNQVTCGTCHVSVVTCHVSCFMCQVSQIIFHVVHVIFHVSHVTNASSHSHGPSPCNFPTIQSRLAPTDLLLSFSAEQFKPSCQLKFNILKLQFLIYPFLSSFKKIIAYHQSWVYVYTESSYQSTEMLTWQRGAMQNSSSNCKQIQRVKT